MLKIGKSWRSKLAVVSFVLVLLYPTLVPAEELQIIPKWTLMEGCIPTTASGAVDGKFACYNFEEAKTLKKLDIDLKLTMEQNVLLVDVHKNLRASLKNMEEAYQKEVENTQILQQRLDSQGANLRDMANKYISANKRDIFGGALPWAIAALAVVATGAFIGGYYIASK